jgi:hypothetical protein
MTTVYFKQRIIYFYRVAAKKKFILLDKKEGNANKETKQKLNALVLLIKSIIKCRISKTTLLLLGYSLYEM